MKPSVSNITLARHAESYRPLAASDRLHFADAACLPLRFADYSCSLCASACPSRAIDLTAGGPRIQGECLGCGQCASACRTDALRVDGFALPTEMTHDQQVISVDCWRVSHQDSPAGSLRVPCLGGISKGWLLSLCERAGAKPIHLLDRGECSFCPAGGGIPTLLATLTEVRTLLFQCGVEIEHLPAMTTQPAKHPFSPSIPSTAGEQRIDRRSFFRGLAGGIARGADALSATGSMADAPIVLRDPITPVEPIRVATALAAIAARHGRPVPEQALPRLSLGNCSAHGICAKVCPTGALSRHEDGTQAELRFHAAKCIGCGQCERTCPDRALSYAPGGGTGGIETLARWPVRICDQCGTSHFGNGGATCASCRKNQQLHQGMAALFGRSLPQ